MYEYGIYNTKTNEKDVVFGRTFGDACRRAKLDPENWEVNYQYYVD